MNTNINLIKACILGDLKKLISFEADIRADDDLAIRYASEYGHIGVVKYLVSLGADIHAHDDEAVLYASKNGHLEVVKYLVSIGANIRINCALRYASKKGHLDVVRYLISLGANINGIENPKMLLTVKCWLEIDKLKHKKRIKAYLIILKRFILNRQAVKCIPYLVEFGVEYFKAKDSFYNPIEITI